MRLMKVVKKFRLGELFCGPGGLGLGASQAVYTNSDSSSYIEHVWATDYDKDSCETYRRNLLRHDPKRVVCQDIRKLEYSRLRQISEIDALAFGFPCNDFSIVGERKGINGVYGPLYSYGVKALEYFQPMWFLAENVSGLKNSNEGNTFELIISELEGAGYKVVPHCYKFEEFGIPQARHRIIIIGIREDIYRDFGIEYNVPSTFQYRGLDITCKNAIENPPILESAYNHEYTKQAPHVIERLKYIKPGENAFTADIPEHLQLNVKRAKISQIYKRLKPDLPAYTITGSGGGGTHVYHWSENRALTNRERARLQTFPDDFMFYGSKESVRKQIGMSVPPAGVKIIFERVLKSFECILQNSKYHTAISE